jgi:hypothetical protein
MNELPNGSASAMNTIVISLCPPGFSVSSVFPALVQAG